LAIALFLINQNLTNARIETNPAISGVKLRGNKPKEIIAIHQIVRVLPRNRGK
jgi:hypothetical protein